MDKISVYSFNHSLLKENYLCIACPLQELMERPLRLKLSEKKAKEAGSEKDEGQGSDDAQLEES